MYKGHSVSAVIAAAGSGTRMNTDKMMLRVAGKCVIEHTVDVFEKCGFFDEIIVVASKNNIEKMTEIFKDRNVFVTEGGQTRGESSLKGIKKAKSEYVLIHDGARMLVTADIIENVADKCIATGCAAAGVCAKDTVKTVKDGVIETTVPRENCILIQTPQGFLKEAIENAYMRFPESETDDCGVMEKTGAKISVVDGSYENIKITTPDDVINAERIIEKRDGRGGVNMRIGTGFDSHRLVGGRNLVIGGCNIPYEKGLLGHSDADVLIHAVIDALLGSVALGDIGTHFPDNDEKYKDISSMKLLSYTAELIEKSGYTIENIDTTIIVQAPKMAPYIGQMRENIADALKIDVSQVSVKAKTNEKMGFTGTGEGIEARAVALLCKL